MFKNSFEFKWAKRYKHINQNKCPIRLKMLHINLNILTRYHPVRQKFHSKRDKWFVSVTLQTGVHVHTTSDPVFMVAVDLHPACELRQRGVGPSLRQPVVFAASSRFCGKILISRKLDISMNEVIHACSMYCTCPSCLDYFILHPCKWSIWKLRPRRRSDWWRPFELQEHLTHSSLLPTHQLRKVFRWRDC